MAMRIFAHQLLKQTHTDQQITALMSEFGAYKEHGILPARFGRDAPYHRPASAKTAELAHIHLRTGKGWPLNLVQWSRTSDTALVYCCGWHDKNNYLLIMIMQNAHAQAEKVTFMSGLADIAERFRAKY